MKLPVLIPALIVCILAEPACSPQAEKVDSEKAKLEAAEHKFNSDFDQFRELWAKKLEEQESLIDQLKEQSKNSIGEDQRLQENTISDLQKKNIDFKKQLKNYRYKGIKNWELFKSEFSKDAEAVGRTLRDMKKQTITH